MTASSPSCTYSIETRIPASVAQEHFAMAYTAEKPPLPTPIGELRSRIPGWGVDLDFKDRPAIPKENFNPGATGARWHFPERQSQQRERERSSEHKFLTPVYGTSCPTQGLSGVVRRYAYRFSEGRLAHWLLLVAADRVDVIESRAKSWLDGKPDSRILETGIRSEFTHGGLRSRLGRGRADWKHQWMDAAVFVAPYVAVAAIVYTVYRRTSRRREAEE
jgi:hypothetical protein